MAKIWFGWILVAVGLVVTVVAQDQVALASQRFDSAAAEDPIVQARREYQITLASLARVERRLAELEAESGADPETLETYRSYRDRLAALAEQQRRELEKRGVPVVAAGPAIAEQAAEADRVAPRPGPVAPPQIRDDVGRLDGQLDASMSEFDGVLMKKQQELAREESDIAENGAESSAAAEAEELLKKLEQNQGEGEGEGEEGQEGEAGAEGEEGEEGEEGSEGPEGDLAGEAGEEGAEMADAGMEGTGAESGEEAGSEGAEGVDMGDLSMPPGEGTGLGQAGDGTNTGFPEGAEGTASGAEADAESKRGPRYRQWAGDDDIVARQLREAAEQETDPVLREKLWKEYESYRKGSQR